MSTASPRPTTGRPRDASTARPVGPSDHAPAAPAVAAAGRRRRRILVLAATGTLAALAPTGCGSGGDDADAERRVVTTDAGTTIVRTTSETDGLRVEVQDSSLYVSATAATPPSVLAAMKGRPLGGRCTLEDGREIGTIQVLWRDDPGDWGANLEVQGVYEDHTPLAEVVRSCAFRRGTPAGPGATDVNAGPVLTTASFVEE